jgi:hypothetical protein
VAGPDGGPGVAPLGPVPAAGFPGDVPPGVVRWGAAIGGNGDPARHEVPAGHALGLRRTFFRWDQRTGSMVRHAAADLAAGRLPWVSVKPPSWAAMAGGAHDAEIDQMLRGLDGLGGPVWLTVHHEPEGGGGVNAADDPGGPAAWRGMQLRVRQRMQALGTRNLALAPILMSWTFDPRSGRDPNQWHVPGVFDFAGVDHYVDDPALPSMIERRDWLGARAFYGRHGLAVAVGEWGNRGTDATAAEEMSAFHRHAVQSAWDGRGARVIGLSYFDSDLHSPTGAWTLAGAPLERFRALLHAQESALLGEV